MLNYASIQIFPFREIYLIDKYYFVIKLFKIFAIKGLFKLEFL
jgi:hypothetical protein